MKSFDPYDNHTHSYLALRKAVGWIGILLPFVLMLGTGILFKEDVIQSSISHYYYTAMRNLFVGALCAVALFLFFYSGYDHWDDWAGNLAGIFALGVAWFPTTEAGPVDLTGKIHFTCATLFFITLAGFSLILFTKKASNPTSQKLKRNNVYIICGILMIACLIGIVIYLNFLDKDSSGSSFVFWAETLALVSFGFSWLTKGEKIYPDSE